ncbi:MAG: YgiT-type zinc finger protein [bacterium]
MFHCNVCGSQVANDEFIDEVFHINGKHVLVEHIPAKVCKRCGEKIFSRETTEKIRCLINGESEPVKSVPMDVFAYAS